MSGIIVVGVVLAGIVIAVHLSVDSMALDLAVQIGRVSRVDHIAVAVAGVALSVSRDGVGRVSSRRPGVGIGGVGGSDAGIVMVVVAVPVSGVVWSIAQVAGSVVGSMGGSVVGSMGRGSVGVGGCGDHGLTGSSAHVHLLTMTHTPLVLA